jgi:hypothetical protein
MKAFNIHLASKNGLALTIAFADQQYKIIYDGGIIGALTLTGDNYTPVAEEDIIAGQLPLYDYKKTNEATDTEPLKLGKSEYEEIAEQIKLEAAAS